MITRIELILRQLAKQHAPHLLAQSGNEIRPLAAGLARHGVLVIYVTLQVNAQEEREQYINNRVSGFANLYTLLTEALFPTFTHISAFDADREDPPVVILQGKSAPVIQLFADVLVPFIAVSQDKRLVSDAELRTVMTILLEELEGQDLPLAQYNAVLREGMLWIRQLLTMPGTQYSLTAFHHSSFRGMPEPPLPPPEIPELATEKYTTLHHNPPVVTRSETQENPQVAPQPQRNDAPQFIPPDTAPSQKTATIPSSQAESAPVAPKPESLPETPPESDTLERELKRSTVPIFYRRKPKKSRRAPVPPPVSKSDED